MYDTHTHNTDETGEFDVVGLVLAADNANNACCLAGLTPSSRATAGLCHSS